MEKEKETRLGGNTGRKQLQETARAWVMANRGLKDQEHIDIIVEKTGASPKLAKELFEHIVRFERLKKKRMIKQ